MTQIIEQFLEVSSTYLLSPCDSDCCHKSAAWSRCPWNHRV